MPGPLEHGVVEHIVASVDGLDSSENRGRQVGPEAPGRFPRHQEAQPQLRRLCGGIASQQPNGADEQPEPSHGCSRWTRPFDAPETPRTLRQPPEEPRASFRPGVCRLSKRICTN
eukprot:scaffold7027_cov376-Pinguiococcus_pyrenoidosus.AAC.2